MSIPFLQLLLTNVRIVGDRTRRYYRGVLVETSSDPIDSHLVSKFRLKVAVAAQLRCCTYCDKVHFPTTDDIGSKVLICTGMCRM